MQHPPEQRDGAGTLTVGTRQWPARFSYSVRRRPHSLDAGGTLQATADAINAAFEAGRAELKFTSGWRCAIIVTRWTPGGPAVYAQADAPVPPEQST